MVAGSFRPWQACQRCNLCRQTSKPMTHLWIKIQQLSVCACLNVKHLQARDEHSNVGPHGRKCAR